MPCAGMSMTLRGFCTWLDNSCEPFLQERPDGRGAMNVCLAQLRRVAL